MGEARNLRAQDKRKLERCPVTGALEAFDVHTGHPLGRVVDISLEGVMISSQAAIPANRIYQLRIPLPVALEGSDEIRLGVESLWSRESQDGSRYWTGFHVICISDRDRACIERLFQASE